jgi:ABC-type antimicrobial peptide transport system permease subunit
MRMVLSDAGRWTLAGALIGTAASAASLRLLQTLLYEVKALDARAFLGALGILAAAAALAAWIPARRAARIEPAAALRAE